jgi:hypothetical protein
VAVCVLRWSAGCAVCFVGPTTTLSCSLLFHAASRTFPPHVIDHANLVVVVAFLLRMFWRRYDYSNSYCLTNSFQETGELFALLYGA